MATGRLMFVRLLMMILMAAVVLAGCTQPAPPAPTKSEAPAPAAKAEPKAAPKAAPAGGKLVVGLTADPDTLDGQETMNLSTGQANQPLYDLLVRYDKTGNNFVPALAEKWDISADGLVYTFNLRKGVKFHDGSPVNAEALAFNFDRALNKDNPFNKLGSFAGARLRYGVLKSWEAVDEYTLRLTLKEPQATLLHYLSFTPIVSAEAVKKWGKDFPLHPSGSGPFRFVSWEKGVRLVLERNPDYWDGPPKIDQLIIVPIPDAQARLTALQTGTIDFTIALPPDSIAALKSNPNFVMQQVTSPHVWYLWMNQKRKPFEDLRVRQALNYAINKQAIVDDVLKGTAVVADGPLSPVFGNWLETDLPKYTYNPDKAKQLLKEAGYGDGFTVNFLVPESGAGLQLPVPMAVVIQSNLAAVGIKANIQTLEFATYAKKMSEGDFDIAPYGFNSSVLDPDFTQAIFHSSRKPPASYNAGSFINSEADKLLMDARKTTDLKQRTEMYKKFQKLVVQEAPVVFVDHDKQMAVMNKKVKGFDLGPTFFLFFEKIYLEP